MTAEEPDVAGEAADDREPFLVLIGSRIRAARRRTGLRQSDVAKASSTSQSYIVGVELGVTNLSMRSMIRIATALGVSPESFFKDLEPQPDAVLDRLTQENDKVRADLDAVRANLDRVHSDLEKAHADLDRVSGDLLRRARSVVEATTKERDPNSPAWKP